MLYFERTHASRHRQHVEFDLLFIESLRPEYLSFVLTKICPRFHVSCLLASIQERGLQAQRGFTSEKIR